MPQDGGDPPDELEDPGLELAGEPLEQRGFCFYDEPQPVRDFADATLGELGACGDAIVRIDGTRMLVPIDGEPELALQSPNSSYAFSPRGRLLATWDGDAGKLRLRDIHAGTELELDGQAPTFGFVISKEQPGARLWRCESGVLDLIVDDQPFELAHDVVCPSIASSPMHSMLVFATTDGVISWAETDQQLVTPTNLSGFEYAPDFALGTRRDSLTMSTSGPYLVYSANTVETVEAVEESPTPVAFHLTLYDLTRDTIAMEQDSGLLLHQAPLFGAPLFASVHAGASDVFVIQDGAAIPIASNVWQLQAGMDSVHALTSEGEVVRVSGDDFAEVDSEQPASPENGFIFTSLAGGAGYAIGITEICATPDCTDHLFALRGFGGETTGQRMLSRNLWPQIHVSEDGTLVTDAIIVDGTLDDWSAFPFPRLLVLAPDGSTVAEWEHHPDGRVVDYARIADGRVAIAYSDIKRADKLMIVDPSAGTITELESYPDDNGEIDRMWVDASGQVAVLTIGTRVRITML